MKRKIIENYIDVWLANIHNPSDIRIALKAIAFRLDQIHYTVRPKNKRVWREEFQSLQILSKRLDLVLPVYIEQAVEQQQYSLLPAHEKCDIYQYRYLARFKIMILNIQLIKGYSLLEQLGWYNSIHNPNGVVRDHMISVYHSWTNHIEPSIIGHIANCQFISNVTNLKKSSDCSMLMPELKSRIKQFNRNLKRLKNN